MTIATATTEGLGNRLEDEGFAEARFGPHVWWEAGRGRVVTTDEDGVDVYAFVGAIGQTLAWAAHFDASTPAGVVIVAALVATGRA